MNCPMCENKCKKGYVYSLPYNPTPGMQGLAKTVSWIQNAKKIFHKERIIMKNEPDAYYCENCKKVFAIFEKDVEKGGKK